MSFKKKWVRVAVGGKRQDRFTPPSAGEKRGAKQTKSTVRPSVPRKVMGSGEAGGGL